MSITWYCQFDADDGAAALHPSDRDRVLAVLGSCRDLAAASVHTPAVAHDPYSRDGPGPLLALELEFDRLPACERSLAVGGPLSALAEPGFLARSRAARVSQQALLSRAYAVPEPPSGPWPRRLCTFLVSYPGPAEDTRAWHHHYVTHHAPIMVRFPGVRVVAIQTPAVVVCGLDLAPAVAMQRNKVAFDSPAALDAALASPVREEMREDFAAFPPFSGGNQHFAMHTLVVRPS